MTVATRKADARARIILPEDFANHSVTIERVSNTELRIRKKLTLAQMLAEITPENVHAEIDFGPPAGKELL